MAPPGILRTTRLLAGLLLRRTSNRWRALRDKKKPKDAAPKRTGTARKGGFEIGLGVLLIGLLMATSPVNMVSRILSTAREQLGVVRDATGSDRNCATWGFGPPSAPAIAGFTGGDDGADAAGELRSAFGREVAHFPEEIREPARQTMLLAFAERTRTPWVCDRGGSRLFLPRLSAWHSPEAAVPLLRLAGVLLIVFAFTLALPASR